VIRDEAERAARQAGNIVAQIRRVTGRLLGAHRLAARLFVGDDGKLRPAAVEWFDQLARDNFVDRSTFVGGDRDKVLINEGRRMLALEIMDSVRLDTRRLAELRRQEQEEEQGR
jgi:hypothetical protein